MNSNRDYATENINLKKRLEVLEQENKELKETIEVRKQMNINLINFGTKLKQENEKLKKAIDILKEHLYVKELDIDYILEFNSLYSNHLTKQEYELLKEVLDK